MSKNFEYEGNWLGCENFHCMLMDLVISMRLIFSDDWNDAPCSPRYLDCGDTPYVWGVKLGVKLLLYCNATLNQFWE